MELAIGKPVEVNCLDGDAMRKVCWKERSNARQELEPGDKSYSGLCRRISDFPHPTTTIKLQTSFKLLP